MSNNNPLSKYDVFVSFRGEDIRHGFLGHLVKAFPRKQISAFVDDKLKRGDDISDSLVEAIEGSSISLVIFSENYASSLWCLEELVKIVECKEKYGQIVIPVFYGVDPTDVRHQKKSYANAFSEHEKMYNLSEVQIWRRALKISANLSGITSSSFRNDAELLEEIIKHVLMSLSKHPVNSKGLVGIDKSISHLESLLRNESKKVRVIGIWGMGGIGKTTIAEEIFSRNYSEYEGYCFLAKVSEVLTIHGMIFLKENLFSKLLSEDVKIHTPNRLSSDIERRIGRMKVLIVLDDVKDTDQLEMLFGTLDWFRSDSRIILTARDKQVLIANEVDDDDIYEVGVLDYSEALALFNLNAFKQSHLKMEYYELSKRVINYAKGIPLVLKVLAHMLRGKTKEVWESQLDKLKRLPVQKVQDVMRLSYDDLDRLEKKYFLDIACFFNRLRLKADYMKLLLKDYRSDNSVAVGLESLKDKALITISEDNVISMHDILQEMGREVVRQESSEDPRRCSRLWDPDSIYDILKNDKSTDSIRSISVYLSEIWRLKLSPHVFDKMTDLQFLDFRGHYGRDCLDLFPQGLQSFPTDLRYLSWMNCPLKSFPEKFSAENLVILDLSYSLVEKLWCGVQNLVNLKEVTIRYSRLKELPDFSEATNLKVLNISGCDELTSVHPSIFSLHNLVKLDLGFCYSLTSFTNNSNLSSLQYLKLGYCRQLGNFSVTIENIVELDLSCCPINALPSSFGCQSKLEMLILISSPIESIPSSIKNLTRLRKLDLRFCSKILILPELPSSVEFLLVQCKSLKSVLFPSTVTEQLKENKRRIEFWNCSSLDEHSLIKIGLNLQINLMKCTYQHLSTLEHDNFDSYAALYVYPGSSVPEWLEYKTTADDMIVDLSSPHLSPLLGFVFCFVVANESQLYRQIELKITTIDVEVNGEKDGVDIYVPKPSFIGTDHVCILYDPPCSRYLTSVAKNQTRFKIKVTARTETNIYGEKPEVEIKGFGISPINHSAYHNLIKRNGEVVHFDGLFVFTADDLLCATAEITGKTAYGTAYKATLEDGNQVSVKWLRDKTTKGHKEFEAEVASLGKIRHPNLLALRSYYLRPSGEKLLVFDYMSRGSLASFLHARGPEIVIEWTTRMKIAIGITNGLSCLHNQESIVHENLTSSNILLDEQTNPHITDFGLSRLMTTSANTNFIATEGSLGYNAPELSKTNKPTTKTDVYSLGVILLELLTGKPPGEPTNGMDLPQYVASIVKEEWTNEVFDLELMRDGPTIGDELLNTLKLALRCLDPSPSARPEINQVLQQLEQIKPELVES